MGATGDVGRAPERYCGICYKTRVSQEPGRKNKKKLVGGAVFLKGGSKLVLCEINLLD